MSDKIKPQHVERKAILYIRQSSAYQVTHNLESQRLQYAMQERLQHLGWREIEVVDEDLGRSAAGTVTRAGFERMVAAVCLGKVGAVASWRVSSNRTGVTGTNKPALPLAALESVNQPPTSAIRSAPPIVNSETLPSAPTGTTTRLARVSPATRLRFDTVGIALPVGHTVTYPSAVA